MSAVRGTYRAAGGPKLEHSHPLTIHLKDSEVSLLNLVRAYRALKGADEDAETLAHEAFGNYLVDSFQLLTGQRWGNVYARMQRGEKFVWTRDQSGKLVLVGEQSA
jgi:hypothetical protein